MPPSLDVPETGPILYVFCILPLELLEPAIPPT